ncbi:MULTISPECIES: hypothetical protein [Caproicibacterium]|uniref:Uncharacterized protein n=1 Tax=Caproicibacterium argilliputei TaxID=3030016 RepID=A0AA97DBE3_9FIRM|nr:hypothetical protein [Caproicibacterium argilliputei]WOC32515.1 hypothetical protein PXC00_01205 [Caproicibacterium argilliputei]
MLTQEELQQLRTGTLLSSKTVANRYERNRGPWRFRDCLLLYYDGRVRLERSCYGEAAGLVFTVWAERVEDDGSLQWQGLPAAAEHVPQQITALKDGALYLDEKPAAWNITEELQADKAYGYRRRKHGLFR